MGTPGTGRDGRAARDVQSMIQGPISMDRGFWPEQRLEALVVVGGKRTSFWQWSSWVIPWKRRTDKVSTLFRGWGPKDRPERTGQ